MQHLIWLIPLLVALFMQIRGWLSGDENELFVGTCLSALGLLIGAFFLNEPSMLLVSILQVVLAVVRKVGGVPEHHE